MILCKVPLDDWPQCRYRIGDVFVFNCKKVVVSEIVVDMRTAQVTVRCRAVGWHRPVSGCEFPARVSRSAGWRG